MKKRFLYIIILFCVLLTGCSGGIYANLRQIEQLLVVETVGIDGDTVTAAATGSDKTPLCLSAEGDTLASAVARLNTLTTDRQLFFAHTARVLLGEDEAADLARVLDYICRSPELRMDIPLFVVRDGSARELMAAVGDVSAVLQTLTDDQKRRGDGTIPTAAQSVNRRYRDGAFLLRAVTLTDGADGETKTVVPSGFAVLKGTSLCAYLDEDCSLAVSVLQDRIGVSTAELSGGAVTVNGGSAELVPVYEDGKLTALRVAVTLNAALPERTAGDAVPELQDELTRQLDAVFSLMREQEADFCGLASRLGLRPGELFAAELAADIRVELVHRYDLTE